MTQKRLTPSDGMFLYMETPETMMHVGGLLPFSPPEGAPPDFVHRLESELRDAPVHPPWSRKLSTPEVLLNPLQAWVDDPDPDLEVHVGQREGAAPGHVEGGDFAMQRAPRPSSRRPCFEGELRGEG
jgi:hypothetical protein